MNRIALISYHSPPMLSAESILVAKTVRRLADSYQIDLITAKDDPDFREDPALLEIMEHPNVTRFAYSTYRLSNKIVRRLMDKTSLKVGRDPYQAWSQGVLNHHDWKLGYRAIYSRSQPGASHLLARLVKQKLQIPWLASFSDPWAYNPYHLGSAKVQKQEQSVMQSADAFIFPTAEILKLMQEHYPQLQLERRSTVIPHCYEPDLYPSLQEPTGTRAFSNPKGDYRFTIAYVGDFYGLRSPEPICKGLRLLAERDPQLAERISFVIVGNIEPKFKTAVEDFNRDWPGELKIVGQVPYLQSLRYMKESDLLILVDAPSAVNLFLPSKLIDYLGAARPILGVTPKEGSTAALLEQCGYPVVEPADPNGIGNALEHMLKTYDRYREQAAALHTSRFQAETIAGQLSTILDQLIEQSEEHR